MSLLRRYIITALLYVAGIYTDNLVALTALFLLSVVVVLELVGSADGEWELKNGNDSKG